MGVTLFPRPWRRRSLKRDMLRAAMAENLAAIHGTRPRPARRPVRGWLIWVLVATAASATVASLAGRSPTQTTAPAGEPAAATDDAALGAQRAGLIESPRPVKPATFHLAVRRVIVDPGHGGTDPGAMTPSGLREKDLTLEIGRSLAAELRAASFVVMMTRTGDDTISLQERADFANRAGGDLFLSIHVNSIPVAERRGVETFYLGAAEDPAVERLAGAENLTSGYALADYRRLLEGIYSDVRHEQSRRFALAIQARLVAAMQAHNPTLQDRGVKRAPFVVLIDTTMPAVLAEVACMSNHDDVELLSDAGYRQGIARALAQGVQTFAATPKSGTVVARRDDGRGKHVEERP